MTREEGRPLDNSKRLDKEIETYNFLDSLEVPYQRVDHAPSMTMEECAKIDKILEAPTCKNLLLCNRQKTQFYLLLLPGDKVFKTAELSKQIGSSRLSFASAKDMEELLDITPGSLSVLGLRNDIENHVTLLIDQEVLLAKYFGCHPCINTSTLRVLVKDLIDKIIPALNHDPIRVDLPCKMQE